MSPARSRSSSEPGSSPSSLPSVQIWRSLDEVPGRPRPHRGRHRQLRRRPPRPPARALPGPRGRRRARRWPVVAVTFDPHPMAVLRPEHAPSTLTSLEVRAELLGEAGVDAVLALPFDRDVAAWSPEEFIERVLVDAPARRAPSSSAPTSASAAAPPATSRTLERRGSAAASPSRAIAARRRPAGLVLDVRPHLPGRRRRRRRRRGARPSLRGARGRRARATSAAASSASRRPTCPPTSTSPRPPTACTPAGCGASTPARPSRRRSASAPTRPSTASGSAAWRATCSTAPTWSCTASRSRSSFVERLRGMVAFDSVEALVEQMDDDVDRARELLVGGAA